MALTMAGERGELRVGGRVAARLGHWDYASGPDGWTVTAAATETDSYWLNASPRAVLHLTIGRRERRWRGVTVDVAGARLIIRGEGDPE